MTVFSGDMIRRSIVRKVSLSIIMIIAVIMSVASVVSLYSYMGTSLDQLRKNADSMKLMLAGPLTQYIWNIDYEHARRLIDASLLSSDLFAVIIRDQSGALIFGRVMTEDLRIADYQSDMDQIIRKRTFLRSDYRLRNSISDNFGVIEFYFTDYFVKKEIVEQIISTLLKVGLLAASCIIFVSLIVKRSVITPILNLRNTVISFSRGNYAARTMYTSSDEIGDLAEQFNRMADTIQKHNEELKTLVEQRTRQLLQAEKMASLGELVAGVSHEINTPIGIGITAASHLRVRTTRFMELYNSGNMTRRDFEEYAADLQEALSLLGTNLERAADLVQSFKKVAVDRTTEDMRDFNLKEYLNDILMSLKPRYKKTGHQIAVECPDNISLKSYPGTFSQIVTNLVMNSLIHGFDGIEHGEISITVSRTGENITMIYSDNGVGIPRENLEKIFEPFFTTRRSSGGTGLGLNITMNLITRNLGGNIICESEPGKGTRFIITFPSEAPAA